MLSTIRELDRPPKQVLIDATIAEVTLDKGFTFGIQGSALTGNVNIQQNTGLFQPAINFPGSNITLPGA